MMRRNWTIWLAIGLTSVVFATALLLAATEDARVANAAMRGDKAAVRDLIKQAVDINAAQGDGSTALHWAASKDDAEMAQMLLYAGANVRATTRIGSYTPLFMAAKSGAASVVDRRRECSTPLPSPRAALDSAGGRDPSFAREGNRPRCSVIYRHAIGQHPRARRELQQAEARGRDEARICLELLPCARRQARAHPGCRRERCRIFPAYKKIKRSQVGENVWP